MYEIYCKLRDEMELSNYAVSKATGIPQSTFSDWKSGRSVPKQEKLQKIADFFGVSLQYLMTGSSGNRVTEEDLLLVMAYRGASASIQESVRKLLDIQEKREGEQKPGPYLGLSKEEFEDLQAELNEYEKEINNGIA